ncbi:MAG: hypothetical protein HY730_03990 [Candidatus Tectomicrobia bacterium]|uniref:Phosphatidate cytidylyltransferase n=1 Tax=Tectimicrobiota bacterium TaxID=2528274 RepID=A0A933GLE9_UNCTE|nr:hypothetical protein [Candidatus Tectomicrobia bacterium]
MIRGEILRRAIHLSGIIIPLGYLFGLWEKTTIAFVLTVLFFLFLTTDLIRLMSPTFRNWFFSHFPGLVKPKENKRLLGSTYFSFGALLATILFEKKVAIASLLFLVVGDQVASLVGKRFGKHRINGKTWEGTITCNLACLGLSLTILPVIASLTGSVTAALSELFISRYVDDNLAIPILSGLVMSLVLLYQ